MKDFIEASAEFKFADPEAAARGEFVGYASVFGNIDLGGDIVERGAFSSTLQKRGAGDVAMLWGHDVRQPPIGKWLELREDDRGLMAKGQLILDVAKARDVHALMKEGALKGLSIGYRVAEGGAEFERNGRVRRIKAVDLFEISVVTMPMNTRAQVQRVKGEGPTIRDAEEALREAGFSRSEAKAILAHGFKAMPQRDADEAGQSQELKRLLATLTSR
ncbi:MAG TPA: HK97 family phage prohead protease [Roseococcus sp.]|jgi:hypothetical protein|nr:HK97 family phage prohead protease [Roseococcus sp.]